MAVQTEQSLIEPINTFAPEPYEPVTPFQVVLERQGDEYAAHFFDANIATAGETQQEAIENLKSLIIDFFEDLESEDPSSLGPGPARQQAVLKSLISEGVVAHQGTRRGDCEISCRLNMKRERSISSRLSVMKEKRLRDLASGGGRRGSYHGYIADQIFANQRFCEELAACRKSREDWLELLRAKGKLS